MTTESAQPVDSGTAAIPATEFVHTPAGTGELSVMDAARSWADARYKREAEATRQAESAETPPAAEPPSAKAETAPAEEPTSGDAGQSAEPEENLPPIEPPKFWKSEEKERFKSLPRDTQAYIAEREQARDAEIRRTQNEAAEQRKAMEAKLSEVEKARTKYVEGLVTQDAAFERESAERFPNIKSQSDVDFLANQALQLSSSASEQDQKLASQINAYLLAWRTHNDRWATIRAERTQAEQQQASERNTKWAEFVQKENAKAAELIPELADKEKGPALMNRVTERLADLGFGQDELRKLATGEEKLSIFDHRLQQMIYSDLKLQDIQKAKASVVAKPLPPAQRPGESKPQSGKAAEIQALEKRLATASGMEAIRLGAELTKARRAS